MPSPPDGMSLRTVATSPIIPSRPVTAGRRWARTTSCPRKNTSTAKTRTDGRTSPQVNVSAGVGSDCSSKKKRRPITSATAPDRPIMPNDGVSASAVRRPIPASSSSTPSRLTGRKLRPKAASRRAMPPRIPGMSRPGFENSRYSPSSPIIPSSTARFGLAITDSARSRKLISVSTMSASAVSSVTSVPSIRVTVRPWTAARNSSVLSATRSTSPASSASEAVQLRASVTPCSARATSRPRRSAMDRR